MRTLGYSLITATGLLLLIFAMPPVSPLAILLFFGAIAMFAAGAARLAKGR